MKRLWLLAAILCYVHTNASAQQGTLLISELLYQPASGEAEYLELYNNGSESVELADFHIIRWVGDSLGRHYTLPQYTVRPHDYVVLTQNAASVIAQFSVHHPGKIVECALPTYPNNGGTVILATADSTLVERFDYNPSMHSRLLRNKGGVSLERRSFDRPVNEASNWFSAASTAGYGTPGYRNSQSTETVVEENAFSISSLIISPDGDDYQDVIEISYQLEDGSLTARCELYNARGVAVRHLLNNDLLGTSGTFVWDGRDNNGQLLPQGQYLLRLTLFDLNGTRQIIHRSLGLIRPN